MYYRNKRRDDDERERGKENFYYNYYTFSKLPNFMYFYVYEMR